MGDRDLTRFTPQHRSAAHAATTTSAPRWFLREAVGVFALSSSDIVVFFAIADNLDSAGVSRTANSLITRRTGMSRTTVVKSLATLIDLGLIVELDEKRSGAIMRYAIPAQRPLTHREIGI